ncbi:hypothetical protein GJ744_004239 [Endocarpon pusillum]|uniref:Uncharacterized protein n=1 Tax=Endocarpon pusillum TaxID=364733 RepID=A0A8H7DXP2_9EURO|nr:hypothetical protein GJ744_004239 [Endocarpon pusillum]
MEGWLAIIFKDWRPEGPEDLRTVATGPSGRRRLLEPPQRACGGDVKIKRPEKKLKQPTAAGTLLCSGIRQKR